MSDRQRPPERDHRLSERERTKVEGRFGMVLLLLIIAVFFSISAPDGLWAWLATAIILAASLSIAMWAYASGLVQRVADKRSSENPRFRQISYSESQKARSTKCPAS